MKFDCVVLGAGMVGVSAALHLQARGRSTALLDRRGPAEETSYGNAGIIQREGVVPYMFPREWATILKYARNNTSEAYYQLSSLPRVAPWLFRYWRASTPEGEKRGARAMAAIVEHCITEHMPLIEAAGLSGLVRRTGYMRVFRTAAALDAARIKDDAVRAQYGVNYDLLDRAAVEALEPHLTGSLAGAIHFTDPVSIADPGALGRGYAELLVKRGGRLIEGEARSLEAAPGGWRVASRQGWIEAREVVVALGPWSGDVMKAQGVWVPLGWKRGYHMHYRAEGNATLSRPVIDSERGYALAPMTKGIRLTTGAEFATRDAPKSPVQLARAEAAAHEIFPLAERVEPEPWLGRRPCFPDMVPAIGPVPGKAGLWVAFGHHHLGFTLGPATGRLLAEMMTGEAPYIDPAPYRIDRF
ncbi:MAG: FAD-dependent oxidoreductase [Hyphomicrobiaceae bacterium]|nr:FAD-dependent oxidoreductase [Hyphomicrobiaceae bacterium]